jgi:hypothetical protein
LGRDVTVIPPFMEIAKGFSMLSETAQSMTCSRELHFHEHRIRPTNRTRSFQWIRIWNIIYWIEWNSQQ